MSILYIACNALECSGHDPLQSLHPFFTRCPGRTSGNLWQTHSPVYTSRCSRHWRRDRQQKPANKHNTHTQTTIYTTVELRHYSTACFSFFQAELGTQLDSARREAENQRAERTREHDVHLAEISALKRDISEKIPQIAENAAETAGRRWRQRAESEVAAVTADKNRRIRESQVG